MLGLPHLVSSCLVLLILFVAVRGEHNFLSNDYVNEINSKQSLWKAGTNFPKSTPLASLRNRLGLIKSDRTGAEIVAHDIKDTVIPESFDSREKWPECPSIRKIYDQASCGSCWAVSTTSCMSDRLCIHSNGTDQRLVSAGNLMTCCGESCGAGCDGGVTMHAWMYWTSNGIVTGGAYNSTEGCQNYPLPSCRHHYPNSSGLFDSVPDCQNEYNETPECQKTCDDATASFNESLTFGGRNYFVDETAESMQIEIMKNGPIVAEFSVFEDFYNYKSGVYKRVSDNYVGDHAVRVLGWGVDNNVSYWLIANSWNDEWGDKGMFKIVRGEYECGIETSPTAGLPKI